MKSAHGSNVRYKSRDLISTSGGGEGRGVESAAVDGRKLAAASMSVALHSSFNAWRVNTGKAPHCTSSLSAWPEYSYKDCLPPWRLLTWSVLCLMAEAKLSLQNCWRPSELFIPPLAHQSIYSLLSFLPQSIPVPRCWVTPLVSN